MVQDIEKWDATLKPPQGELLQEEKHKLKLKQEAVKRVMLLYGSGALKIHGNYLDENGEVQRGVRGCSSMNLPTSIYLSGHGGRAYFAFEAGKGQEVLNWITSGDKKSDVNIHKDRYFIADNREKNLTGDEVMFDRYLGTHGARLSEDGKIIEEKGLRFGIRSMFARVFNKVTFGAFLPTLSPHLGMNIPYGGLGNEYKNIEGAKITQDGKSGHAYFNLNSSARGDTLGISCEGTAPRTSGSLGAHSSSGNADQFSMGEAEKYFIKYSTTNNNLIYYLNAIAKTETDEKKKNTINQYIEDVNNDRKRGFFAKLFNLNVSATNENLDHAIEVAGLHILKDEKGKPAAVSTRFGEQLLQAGMGIPDNYNGLKVEQQMSSELINDIMRNKDLPDEIIYYKPQDNLKAFLAQEPIFKDIDNKPAIKNNPQLSLDECYTLSLLYDLKKSENISRSMKQALGVVIDVLDPRTDIAKRYQEFYPQNTSTLFEKLAFLPSFLEGELRSKPLQAEYQNINKREREVISILLQETTQNLNEVNSNEKYNNYEQDLTNFTTRYVQGQIEFIADNYNTNRVSSMEQETNIDYKLKEAAIELRNFLNTNEAQEVIGKEECGKYKKKINHFTDGLSIDNENTPEKLREYSVIAQRIKDDVLKIQPQTQYAQQEIRSEAEKSVEVPKLSTDTKKYIDRIREITNELKNPSQKKKPDEYPIIGPVTENLVKRRSAKQQEPKSPSV